MALAFADHGGRGQVDVFIPQMPIEGNSAAILVAGSQRHQEEGLGEACSRGDRAAFASFQRCDVLAELGVDHRHLLEGKTD